MARSCTVYGLYDPLGDLHYVGQTQGPLWKRLADHVAKASPTDSRPVLRWLWEIYSAGGAVTIAPLKLDAVPNNDEKAIIRRLIADRHSLLNVEHSGAKSDLMKRIGAADPTINERRRKACSAAMTPERRAATSAQFKGKPKSPEHRAKISAATKGRVAWQKRSRNGAYC
jgi:hypothetical protein